MNDSLFFHGALIKASSSRAWLYHKEIYGKIQDIDVNDVFFLIERNDNICKILSKHGIRYILATSIIAL